MKKILVIINKNWETEPVLNALTNPKLRPAALPFPEVINTPCDGDNRMSQPRAVFSLPREGEEPLQVVVRCIEDLMATGVNTSSSLEKYKASHCCRCRRPHHQRQHRQLSRPGSDP